MIQQIVKLLSRFNPLRRILSAEGSSALEAALIFPIFILLICGVVEFGFYFVKQQVVARSVGVVALDIENNPSDPNLQTFANNSGGGIIPYGTGNNYICAQSYSTITAANSGTCSSGTWNISAPGSGIPLPIPLPGGGSGGAASSPYYVLVEALANYTNITPLTRFATGFSLSNIVQKQIVQVNPSSSGGSLHTAVTIKTGSGSFTCAQGLVTSCDTVLKLGGTLGLACPTTISGNTCTYGGSTNCYYSAFYAATTNIVCGYVQ